MQGFNGTIFAYGQTGSGKTFTITGGAERYVDRGIIPRTIAAVYSEVSKQAGYTFQVSSYAAAQHCRSTQAAKLKGVLLCGCPPQQELRPGF
jgi:hypothetical protein